MRVDTLLLLLMRAIAAAMIAILRFAVTPDTPCRYAATISFMPLVATDDTFSCALMPRAMPPLLIIACAVLPTMLLRHARYSRHATLLLSAIVDAAAPAITRFSR